MECVTPILLKKSLQSVKSIPRALPENCNDSLHLSDPAIVFATMALLLPVPEFVGLQHEFLK